MMMDIDDPILITELRRDEGVRYLPYMDSVGIPTTGIGHNLKASPLPEGWKYPLTDAQVDKLLSMDLKNVFHDLDHAFPWWRDLSYARQRCMANLCFNLGISGLSGFKNTLAAIKKCNFVDAKAGLLSSKWARQVGNRANRIADMMENG